ncbi:MAG: STAS domain-containing protein [Candidatus Omnitrophica bacterium]|jgi:anti-sigma B factor antagonist|nr:STAS domain-containing protein [Candidatus Omnitrophota bacterium]
MNITEEKKGGITICNISGEINITTSPQLRKSFESFVEANVAKIVVDFSQVSYIDSSGLATFIELLQRLKKIGGTFRICNMNQKVKNIFEVTKLHKLFEIFDTREAALSNFL